MNSTNSTNATTALLFPHTHVTEPELNRIRSRFPRLTVCLPWYMESPLPSAAEAPGPSVDVLRPPESLKPSAGFDKLLAECRNWMMRNRGHGYAGLVKALQEGQLQQYARWEIRGMIRRGVADPEPVRSDAVKWHLVLHLARETEESRTEANVLLAELKHLKSPLEEALGGESAGRDLLEDVTPFRRADLFDRQCIPSIMEAWVGLFGHHAKARETLLTLDPHVAAYLEERLNWTLEAGAEDVPDPLGTLCRWTRLSPPPGLETGNQASNPVSGALFHKSVIMMEPR